MHPIDFEGTNIELVKPVEMTDEQCMAVRAYKGVDVNQFPFILTAWMPNKEDLDAMNAGRPLMVKMLGELTPPISLWTYDENMQINQ